MLHDRYINFVTSRHYKECRVIYLDYNNLDYNLDWCDFIIMVTPKEQNLNVWDKIKYEQNFNDLKNILLDYLITDDN